MLRQLERVDPHTAFQSVFPEIVFIEKQDVGGKQLGDSYSVQPAILGGIAAELVQAVMGKCFLRAALSVYSRGLRRIPGPLGRAQNGQQLLFKNRDIDGVIAAHKNGHLKRAWEPYKEIAGEIPLLQKLIFRPDIGEHPVLPRHIQLPRIFSAQADELLGHGICDPVGDISHVFPKAFKTELVRLTGIHMFGFITDGPLVVQLRHLPEHGCILRHGEGTLPIALRWLLRHAKTGILVFIVIVDRPGRQLNAQPIQELDPAATLGKAGHLSPWAAGRDLRARRR